MTPSEIDAALQQITEVCRSISSKVRSAGVLAVKSATSGEQWELLSRLDLLLQQSRRALADSPLQHDSVKEFWPVGHSLSSFLCRLPLERLLSMSVIDILSQRGVGQSKAAALCLALENFLKQQPTEIKAPEKVPVESVKTGRKRREHPRPEAGREAFWQDFECQARRADPVGLGRLPRLLQKSCPPTEIAVLHLATELTQVEAAMRLGFSQAHFSQVQGQALTKIRSFFNTDLNEIYSHWQELLAAAAASEEQLLLPFLDPTGDQDLQMELGRMLLKAWPAKRVRLFGRLWPHYWSTAAARLEAEIQSLLSTLPLSEAAMQLHLQSLLPGLPAEDVPQIIGGRAHYVPALRMWLPDGTAAIRAVLKQLKKPLSGQELSQLCHLAPRSIRALTARDPEILKLGPPQKRHYGALWPKAGGAEP